MRHYNNWLKAFIEYASFGEAPLSMYFWVGVSAVAGALRRRVWIEQGYFQWLPNFYVVLVAPPGIVAKSTTASIAMQLLRSVPGIQFGPDVVTWQALAQSLGQATEMIEMPDGLLHPMSAVMIESSEFGNFLNPSDREMVDMLVCLWDGRKGAFRKLTKTQGEDIIENPCINIVACTTPAWISGNFPEYMIGGGFVSRCVFVYAEEKRAYVAYPGTVIPADFVETQQKLVHDLEIISQLRGEYILLPETLKWGEVWYKDHYENRPAHLSDERFGGYISRKQTHIHKLAMVIAAACRDELIITIDDLKAANELVTALEEAMPRVFAQIGRTELSKNSESMLSYIRSRGTVEYKDLFRNMFRLFPSSRDFEAALMSIIQAEYVKLEQRQDGHYIVYRGQ